jgi:hypothetical protein
MDTEKEKEKVKIVLTEEDKLNFFKSFLNDSPYSEEMSLFDGKYKVKFQTLTAQQTNDVFNQLRRSQMNDEITNDPSYILSLSNFKLAQGLISINGTAFCPEIDEKYKPIDSNDSYIKAKAKVLMSWPIFKLSAINEAFKLFEQRVLELTAQIQEPNFWVAAK